MSRRACGRSGRGGTRSRGSAAGHCPCLSSARSPAAGWRQRAPGRSSGAASAWAPRLGIAASGFEGMNRNSLFCCDDLLREIFGETSWLHFLSVSRLLLLAGVEGSLAFN